MSNNTEKFLADLFREHYDSVGINSFSSFDSREFGVAMFDYPDWDGFWKRYFQFDGKDDLLSYVLGKNRVPADLYFSVCSYENPKEREGWKWADIAIEFDIDDFYECPDEHQEDLFCDKCYDFMIDCSLKMKKMLLEDFGLKKSDLQVKFSGHRGMHFRITGDMARKLSSDGRKRLVEYIKGKNIIAEKLGFYVTKSDDDEFIWKGPNPNQSGWKGRSCEAVGEWLKDKDYDDFNNVGIGEKGAKALSGNKKNFNKAKDGEWEEVFPSNVFPQDVQTVVSEACSEYMPEPDSEVAIDIRRVFRVPNSVHHFGLLAKPVSIDNISNFNPWKDACVGDSDRKVKIKLRKKLKNIKLNDREISGEKGDIFNLSLAPACTLLSCHYADIVS